MSGFSRGNVSMSIIGACVMLAIFGMPYLWGAWDIGRQRQPTTRMGDE